MDVFCNFTNSDFFVCGYTLIKYCTTRRDTWMAFFMANMRTMARGRCPCWCSLTTLSLQCPVVGMMAESKLTHMGHKNIFKCLSRNRTSTFQSKYDTPSYWSHLTDWQIIWSGAHRPAQGACFRDSLKTLRLTINPLPPSDTYMYLWSTSSTIWRQVTTRTNAELSSTE